MGLQIPDLGGYSRFTGLPVGAMPIWNLDETRYFIKLNARIDCKEELVKRCDDFKQKQEEMWRGWQRGK